MGIPDSTHRFCTARIAYALKLLTKQGPMTGPTATARWYAARSFRRHQYHMRHPLAQRPAPENGFWEGVHWAMEKLAVRLVVNSGVCSLMSAHAAWLPTIPTADLRRRLPRSNVANDLISYAQSRSHQAISVFLAHVKPTMRRRSTHEQGIACSMIAGGTTTTVAATVEPCGPAVAIVHI